MAHHHYEDVIDTSGKKTHPGSKEAILEKEKEIEKLQEEKEKIIKDAVIKNEKAYSLAETLKKLKESREEIEKNIIEVKKELNKHCTHEKFTTKKDNYSGSYLDRSEHIETDVCDWCGIVIDKRVSYGGYG